MKDEKLNEHELLGWLETIDFESLSDNQKKLVLSEMSKDDYVLKRNIIVQAGVLFNETENRTPKPLVLPAQPTTFMTATVPLYQALLSVAAVLIFMLLAYPFVNMTSNTASNELPVRIDTIKTEVVKYDTVEVVVEKPVIKKQIVYVEVPVTKTVVREMPRLLDVPQNVMIPNITGNTIRTKGVSMKKDTGVINLPLLN